MRLIHGISGEPAKQVGILLQELGAKRQVLCITHQPQIAAKGHSHLYVYKEQKEVPPIHILKNYLKKNAFNTLLA
jgi:DNA repair ATPase RecN